jgi:hypothetical protein
MKPKGDGIDVHAEHPLRRHTAHQRTDEGAVITALNAVARIAQARHQLGEGLGDPAGRPAALGQRRREAVADEGGDYEVKRLPGVEPMRPGIAERSDDVEELDDRTRPAVQQDQRARVRLG